MSNGYLEQSGLCLKIHAHRNPKYSQEKKNIVSVVAYTECYTKSGMHN